MLGTAFPATRLLLVEQPGPWGRAGLRGSRFDHATAAALEARAADAGLRVLAIRRPGRTPRGARRHWAIADCRPGHEALRWGGYGNDADLLELPLDGTAGTSDEAPIYLVCAHSKHDTCCALRGRPVAAALAQERPGRVWECSHVGGERFAANVLVLPGGLRLRAPGDPAFGRAARDLGPGGERARVGSADPGAARPDRRDGARRADPDGRAHLFAAGPRSVLRVPSDRGYRGRVTLLVAQVAI